eukprot:g12869.t1
MKEMKLGNQSRVRQEYEMEQTRGALEKLCKVSDCSRGWVRRGKSGLRFPGAGIARGRVADALGQFGKLGHVDLRCAIVNQKVDAGLMVNEKVASEDNIADINTKPANCAWGAAQPTSAARRMIKDSGTIPSYMCNSRQLEADSCGSVRCLKHRCPATSKWDQCDLLETNGRNAEGLIVSLCVISSNGDVGGKRTKHTVLKGKQAKDEETKENQNG